MDNIHPTNICFVVHPDVHILDLAGPCQAFYELKSRVSQNYNITFASVTDKIVSEQGLTFSELTHLSELSFGPSDIIFVAGIDFKKYTSGSDMDKNQFISQWLKQQYASGATLCSVCSATLIFADAGILDNKRCTSHWKCIEYIRNHYPAIRVLENQVFVKDRRIYTSAGMTSGVDLALSIIEERHGPVITAKVAREMVVYMRRTGEDAQISHYLDYKTHFDPRVHKVQDIICSNLSVNYSIKRLAERVNMSERNLTRAFRLACGISIANYRNKMRLEVVEHLRKNKTLSIEQIAQQCGFKSPRQLYRLWNTALRGELRH